MCKSEIPCKFLGGLIALFELNRHRTIYLNLSIGYSTIFVKCGGPKGSLFLLRGVPNEELEGEPGVAHALHIEEGVVRVRPVLVQRPSWNKTLKTYLIYLAYLKHICNFTFKS